MKFPSNLAAIWESPPKMDNVIKRMNRTTLIFGAKIILFATYTDYFLQKRYINTLATDGVFRESLLKLKMYLCKQHLLNTSQLLS